MDPPTQAMFAKVISYSLESRKRFPKLTVAVASVCSSILLDLERRCGQDLASAFLQARLQHC